jgi:hypothetical protein
LYRICRISSSFRTEGVLPEERICPGAATVFADGAEHSRRTVKKLSARLR